jgi:hypothetical protein
VETGLWRALWRWGALLVHNDTLRHTDKGLSLTEEAAKHGFSDTRFTLGKLLFDGVTVIQNEKAVIR